MAMVPENLGKYFYRDNTLKSEQAKKLYDEVLAYFTHNYATEIPVTFQNRDEALSDMCNVLVALYYDWPELFFLNTRGMLQTMGDGHGTFTLVDGYSAEEVRMVRFHMKCIRDYLLKGTEEEPILRREQVIYERVTQLLRYNNRQERHDHNLVAPIFRATGVCEGINALLILALRAAGIPAIKVVGCAKYNGGGHAWAIAWPDLNTPVHLDATWDLTSPVSPDVVWENHGERCKFRYFNLSDRQISEGHDGYKKDYIPRCQKEYLNYDKICNI